jgi:hypothetical protein
LRVCLGINVFGGEAVVSRALKVPEFQFRSSGVPGLEFRGSAVQVPEFSSVPEPEPRNRNLGTGTSELRNQELRNFGTPEPREPRNHVNAHELTRGVFLPQGRYD